MSAEQADLPSLVEKRRAQITNAPRWYVLECYEGKDKVVYGRLAALGFEVWRPVMVVRSWRRWKGKALGDGERIKTYAPIFGRYLFIRIEMTDSIYNAVREQTGVDRWICYAGTNDPTPVPDEHIATLRKYSPQRIDTPVALSVGDKVRIVEGAFVGAETFVTRVDSPLLIWADVDIFGRPTPTIIPVGHVTLVEQGRAPDRARRLERPRKRA